MTDDFSIADYIDRSAPALDVIILGGSLRKGHRYITGPLTLRMLEMLRPDKAFVTPTSYVPGRGLMTNNQEMAELKQAFLHCANETYVLMDASKIDAPGLLWFGTLEGVEAIVVDADPTTSLRPTPRKRGASLSWLQPTSRSASVLRREGGCVLSGRQARHLASTLFVTKR